MEEKQLLEWLDNAFLFYLAPEQEELSPPAQKAKDEIVKRIKAYKE